jgi:hypothetical protein
MRTLAEIYRQKGEEASLQASEDSSPFIRQMSAKISDHWHKLAERLERGDEHGGRSDQPPEESLDDLIKTLVIQQADLKA